MRRLAMILAAIGWATLFAHLLLSLADAPNVLAGLARYLSFFTILTNLLVALVLTIFALDGPWAQLANPRTATAVAAYAIMVELVYTSFLRWQWHPTGLQIPIDIVLHDVMPLGYLIFWAVCIPKGKLQWLHAIFWLAYPLLFVGWNLSISAAIRRPTAYSFLDPHAVGVSQMAAAITILTIAFWIVGLALIATDKALARARK